MGNSAKRTDEALWETVKAEVTAGDKGGRPGEWSARKAQMAVSAYKKRGGGYAGEKTPDNSLAQWTEEDWGTQSGRPSGETHERYLPKAAREALTKEEYRRSTAAKRRDTARGRQFSAQPEDVAQKAGQARRADGLKGKSVRELRAEAARRGVRGRSGMRKDELIAALAG